MGIRSSYAAESQASGAELIAAINDVLAEDGLLVHRSFGPLKQIDAGLLNVGYAEAGPADGPLVSSLNVAWLMMRYTGLPGVPNHCERAPLTFVTVVGFDPFQDYEGDDSLVERFMVRIDKLDEEPCTAPQVNGLAARFGPVPSHVAHSHRMYPIRKNTAQAVEPKTGTMWRFSARY
jgi:hypothetical protein